MYSSIICTVVICTVVSMYNSLVQIIHIAKTITFSCDLTKTDRHTKELVFVHVVRFEVRSQELHN